MCTEKQDPIFPPPYPPPTEKGEGDNVEQGGSKQSGDPDETGGEPIFPPPYPPPTGE